MPDYLFLMHDDTGARSDDWGAYLAGLRELGALQGGSAIGGGVCARKWSAVPGITAHLTGFIRIEAESLDHAAQCCAAIRFMRPAARLRFASCPAAIDPVFGALFHVKHSSALAHACRPS